MSVHNINILNILHYNTYGDHFRFLVVVNFGDDLLEGVNLASSHSDIPSNGELMVVTQENALNRNRKVGDEISLRNVDLAAKEAAVFMWPYSR